MHIAAWTIGRNTQRLAQDKPASVNIGNKAKEGEHKADRYLSATITASTVPTMYTQGCPDLKRTRQ